MQDPAKIPPNPFHPPVSVVISHISDPSRPIQPTLDALRLQTYPNFEVILIQSAQTSPSATDIKYPDIRIEPVAKATASAAKNAGIQVSAGELVAFLDAGSVPEPRWLEELVAPMANPKVEGVAGLVFCDGCISALNTHLVAHRTGDRWVGAKLPLFAWTLPIERDAFVDFWPGNTLYRRSTLVDLDGYDERFEHILDESDLCIRISDRAGRLEQLPRAIVHRPAEFGDRAAIAPMVRHPYAAAKERVFFAIKYARLPASPIPSEGPDRFAGPMRSLINDSGRRLSSLRDEARWAREKGHISEAHFKTINDAMERGFKDAETLANQPVPPARVFAPPDPARFKLFATTGFSSAPKRTMNISMLMGLVVTRDAMSNICRQHLAAILAWGQANQIDINVRIYAGGTEVQDSRIVQADSVASVVADGHFQTSQLIIAEFGCVFTLFDAIHFAPRGARTVVCYYGITPPAIMPGPMAGALRASYRQACAMIGVDRVITTSQFLKHELIDMGIEATKITIVALSVSITSKAARPQEQTHQSGRIKLAYLGRLVSSKGVSDLIEAVRLLKEKSVDVDVAIMGSRRLSNPIYIDSLEDQIRVAGLNECVHLLLDLGNEDVAGKLAEADALVIPSYHEGFCVPVIEALSVGSFVITSDRGSLPEVTGGLGRTFRAHDATDLCTKIEELGASLKQGGLTTDRGFLPRDPWHQAVAEHLKTFKPARCDEAFLVAAMEGVRTEWRDADQHLADVRLEAVGQFHDFPIVPIDTEIKDQTEAASKPTRPVAFYREPETIASLSPVDYPSKVNELIVEQSENFINGVYDLFLGRFPEPDGMKSWIDSMKSGTPRMKIIEQIAFSDEALVRKPKLEWLLQMDHYRYPRNYTAEIIRIVVLSDEEFLVAAFKILLSREIDESARETFMAKLKNGVPRLEIIRIIGHSDEGLRRLIDVAWLDQLPDLDDLIRLAERKRNRERWMKRFGLSK